MAIFKIPFSVVNGSVSKHQSGNIEASAQVVTFAVKTLRGELPMEPTFGISDPVFDPDNAFEAMAVLRQFWPEIVLSDFKISNINNSGVVDIKIQIGN